MKLNKISLLPLAVTCLLVMGCVHVNQDDKKFIDNKTLNAAADYLEEFGSITISEPILAKSDKVFNFNLDEKKFNPEAYYEHAKNQQQGKASLLQKYSMALGASATGQFDPTQSAAYDEAIKKYKELDRQNQANNAEINAQNSKIRDLAESEFEAQLTEAKKLPVMDRVDAIDKAIATYKQRMALAGAASNPFPALGSNNVPALNSPANSNSVAGDVGAFTANRGLLPDGGLTISDRVALKIAQGDSAMQAIFNVLGNAEKLTNYKTVYYGVSMVSVMPGWRTHKGYSANVSLIPRITYLEERNQDIVKKYLEANKGSCIDVLLKGNMNEKEWKDVATIIKEYRKSLNVGEKDVCDNFSATSYAKPAEEDPLLNGEEAPYIVAISPMSSSQILDLSSSQHDKLEFSLALALALRNAGQELQAKTFLDYAQSLETDFQTVTEENAVNISSYKQVDIQVGPESSALTGSKKNKTADMVLERQTFPVLLLFAFRPTVLPQIVSLQDVNAAPPEKSPESGVMVLKIPQISFQQVQQWTRVEPLGRMWPLKSFAAEKRDAFSNRLELAEQLMRACPDQKDVKCVAANSLLHRMGFGKAQNFKPPLDSLIFESENLVEENKKPETINKGKAADKPAKP